MKEIKLTQGKVALVDESDYEWLNQRKWCAVKGRCTYYCSTHIWRNDKRTTILMHRLLFDNPKNRDIDHIDHNGLNNTRENLRICTHQQNQFNSRYRHSASGYKGVFRCKGKWKAQICMSGIKKFLGVFKSKHLAAVVYNLYALRHHGEFASLNPIKPED